MRLAGCTLRRTLGPILNKRNLHTDLHTHPDAHPDAHTDAHTDASSHRLHPDDLTPSSEELLRNIERYPDAFLLSRTGSSYNAYFSAALKLASILGLPLTQRKFGSRQYPALRFPTSKLVVHLRKLVLDHRLHVAVAEEFRTLRPSGKSVKIDRRITRLVTPASFLQDHFVNENDNSFLLAVGTSPAYPDHVGLAWVNVSSGDMYSLQSPIEFLSDEIYRVNPSQLVLADHLRDNPHHPVFTHLKLKDPSYAVSYSSIASDHASIDDLPPAEVSVGLLKSHTDTLVAQLRPPMANANDDPEADNAEASDPEASEVEVNAHIPSHSNPSTTPSALQTLEPDKTMQIDAHTLRALEIRSRTVNFDTDRSKGHLLDAVDNTVTAGGRRLLTSRLCFPSKDLTEISKKQALVACLYEHLQLRFSLQKSLEITRDAARLLQLIITGRGTPASFLDLADFIESLQTISNDIPKLAKDLQSDPQNEKQSTTLQDVDVLLLLLQNLPDHSELLSLIRRAVKETVRRPSDFHSLLQMRSAEKGEKLGPYMRKDKWLILPEYNEALSKAHIQLRGCYQKAESLQKYLAEKYGSSSLELRYLSGKQPIIHLRSIKEADKLEKDPDVTQIRSTARTRQYMHKKWTELSTQIMELRRDIRFHERLTYEHLTKQTLENNDTLRVACSIADELDVALSFAIAATKQNYTRPILDNGVDISLVNGRHPSIEQRLQSEGRAFVANSIDMIENKSGVHLVTGPNMGGKSTFLRTVAQITLLAQAGSFVPADKAHIGIVDQIFIRMGSGDSLFKGRSSFLVEMSETVDILNRFSKKSLLLMDEIGRGSAGDDGTALAYATIDTVINKGARALFTTHYHHLAPLLGFKTNSKGIVPEIPLRSGVAFSAMDVLPTNGSEDKREEYTYRVREGVSLKSDGIKVAKMAGMPEELVGIAALVLKDVENSVREGEKVLARK